MDRALPFEFRGVYECGWNLFHRRGFSDDPRDIAVNFAYLDHLAAAGINWLVVFWTNGPGFDAAWEQVVPYAHARGIKVARGVYAYSGGGPEYSMAEPDAPPHLLCDAPRGSKMALCPHDPAAQEWMRAALRKRLEPAMDGIMLEPARAIDRHCTCERCQHLQGYAWDVTILSDLAAEVHRLRPEVEVVPYCYIDAGMAGIPHMAAAYAQFPASIRHIFAWGADDDATRQAWLEAEPRCGHFAKLGRVLLFPGGGPPALSVEERVAEIFRCCREAAVLGKRGYLFDYRIFGGQEWPGHAEEMPVTRVSPRLPASLGVIGAAMQHPFATAAEQQELLHRLRQEADWDLVDPQYFYKGDPARGTRVQQGAQRHWPL